MVGAPSTRRLTLARGVRLAGGGGASDVGSAGSGWSVLVAGWFVAVGVVPVGFQNAAIGW
jgi:hypothetical protein